MLGAGQREGRIITAVAKTIELTTSGKPVPMVITGQVERLVRSSGVKTGIVACTAMGVGAAVMCLEGDDTRLGIWTDRLVGVIASADPTVAPQLLSQLYGQSITLPVDRSTLLHDPWQHVVVIDFGAQPRRRLIAVHILGD